MAIITGTVLLDRGLIDEIRRIEHATGRNDVLSGFIRTLEGKLAPLAR